MASSTASASCCFSSSPVVSSHRRLLTTSSSAARLRLILPSAPYPSLRAPICSCSLDDVAAQDAAAGDWSEEEEKEEERDDGIGFEIQVSKVGKRNRRLVRARVRVDAPLHAVWATLTDYEALADFIPGLSLCRLLHQDHRFARLYQVGEQDLALGFKFNAKGTIDCYEGEMELLPAAGVRRREIAFKMIDGDFKFFEGKWSVEEVDGSIVKGRENSEEQGFQTTLSYGVELEPKLWVPVRLLEGRICSEIKNNLVAIRDQAQKIQRLQQE